MTNFKITPTQFPEVTNCERCDNRLIDRQDDMKTIRVGQRVPGTKDRWTTREWICEPCGREHFPHLMWKKGLL